jgi:ribose transport system permease protein
MPLEATSKPPVSPASTCASGRCWSTYAIAAAVIGGTSLAGGIGTIWGTIIGVFIMSVLATGLPALNLEAHYQTFFTGVIVIGAVLLDMYRNKKAAEVRIETPADLYKASMLQKIAAMRQEASSRKAAGEAQQAAEIDARIAAARNELKAGFSRMKAAEKAEQARIRAEEKAADHELAEMVKHKDAAQEKENERQP